MRRLILAAALVTALGGATGGCSLFQSGSDVELALQMTEAEACGVVGVGLSGVAPFRKSGKLSAADAAVVSAGILPVTDPICSAPTPPSATQLASRALTAAAAKAAALAAKYVSQ